MQNLETGELTPMQYEMLKNIPISDTRPLFEKLGEVNEQLQRAKDAAIPKRENQGPIFAIGEELTIRGGKFRVHAISGKRIYLDSILSK